MRLKTELSLPFIALSTFERVRRAEDAPDFFI